MQINYNVTGEKRKSLVGAISQELNAPTKYLGAPTFAYEVGGYHIDKNGVLRGDDNPGLVADLQGLYDFKAITEEYDTPLTEAEPVPEDVQIPYEAALGGTGKRLAVLVDGLGGAAVIGGIAAGQALLHERLALIPLLVGGLGIAALHLFLLGLLGSGRFLLRGIGLLLFSKGGTGGEGEGNQGNGEFHRVILQNGVMGTAWEFRKSGVTTATRRL